MSKRIVFIVPATPVGYSAPAKARLEQAATLAGVRALVAESLLVDLGLVEAPQELVWEVEIDGTQYYFLTLLSAINEPSPTIVIGPAAAVGKVIVEVWTQDAIGKVVEGLIVRVVPTEIPAEAGAIAIVTEGREPSNAAGYAAVEINADSGSYNIVVANKAKPLDTAGKSGQVLNWNDL